MFFHGVSILFNDHRDVCVCFILFCVCVRYIYFSQYWQKYQFFYTNFCHTTSRISLFLFSFYFFFYNQYASDRPNAFSFDPILRISTALASLLLGVPEASQMLNTTLKTAVHREPKKQVWLFSIYENENRKISWQITETIPTSGLVEFEYMNMDRYREERQ